MPNFDYETKRIVVKVVYYGPAHSGKKTSLEYIHEQAGPELRGPVNTLSAESDQIMYFGITPPHIKEIKTFSLLFQLYTVSGQVKSNNTRKMVLEGVDALIFVADSQRSREKANTISFGNLKENLRFYGLQINDLPVVFSYNKRDKMNILSAVELNRFLNPTDRCPTVETIANKGKGVVETFEIVSNLIVRDIVEHLQHMSSQQAQQEANLLELPGLEESLDFDIDQELTLITEEEEEERPFSYLDIPLEQYQDGDVIYEKGDSGDHMYFIEKGQVKIVASYQVTKKVLATLEKGDFFGEMALLGEKKRSSRAVALGETSLLPITRENLASQIHSRPDFAMSFLETLSRRMKTSNENMGKLLDQNKKLKQQVQKAQAIMKNAKQKNAKLSEQLVSTNNTVNQLVQQNKALTQSLEAVNRVADQNKEVQVSLKRAQNSIKNLMAHNKTLQQQKQELLKKNRILKKKSQELTVTIVRNT